MGHIKEPKGVDLVINSRPLTKKEELAISKYIKDYKAQQRLKKNGAKAIRTKTIRKKIVG